MLAFNTMLIRYGGENGEMYVAIYGVDEVSTYIDYTRVYALDADTGRRRWVSTVEGISLADTGIFATSKYLIIDGRFEVAMLDIGSGDLLKIHTFADVLTAGWVEDDWFWFMTEEEGLFNCEESYVNKVTGSFFTVIPTVETGTVIYRDGDLFCWFWESNYVTRYSDAVSSFAERMDDYTPEFDEMDFVDEDIIANEGYNINEQLLEYALYSKDKKYIVAIFTDKVIRIYDTQTKECVGTLISEDEQIEELRYSELTNCYILSGSNSYLMDDKFNVFCETCRIVGEEGNELILMSQDFDVYRIPSLSYEDMLKRADEYLGDYTPPEEVCQKYGIKSVNGDGSD